MCRTPPPMFGDQRIAPNCHVMTYHSRDNLTTVNKTTDDTDTVCFRTGNTRSIFYKHMRSADPSKNKWPIKSDIQLKKTDLSDPHFPLSFNSKNYLYINREAFFFTTLGFLICFASASPDVRTYARVPRLRLVENTPSTV